MNRLCRLLPLVLIQFLILPPLAVIAEDPLAELAKSDEIKRLEARNRQNAAQRDLVLQQYPNSNLTKLFMGKNQSVTVAEWLRPISQNYRLKSQSAWRSPDFIKVNLEYYEDANVAMQVLVLIPHPASLTMVELEVIDEFEQIEPPKLKIDRSEDLEFEELRAKIYYRADAGCSVVFKAVRGSVVEIKTPSCSNVDKLIDFTKSLDLSNLNRKLES